jgi:TonB family protein
VGSPIVSQGALGSGASTSGRLLGDTELANRKKRTVESLKSNPLDDEKWGKQKGPFSMEGPLKYRKILKMELPTYPRWAEEQGVEASISIRLWVSPDGHVKDNMYLERTTGYSELDHMAMDALKKFVFVPLPSEQEQTDEWGVATFRFELKK